MSTESQTPSQAARVTVVYADAARVVCVDVPWREGMTVADALAEAPAVTAAAGDTTTCGIGVWGEAVGLATALAPGDRVELVPPLPNDPKEARRQRALEAKARRR